MLTNTSWYMILNINGKFMKILISVSAPTFVKGQKVAVKIKKNEWYCGSITTVKRDGGYIVTLNDGDQLLMADNHPTGIPVAARLKPITKKGKKSAYTDKEILELLEEKTAKPVAVKAQPASVQADARSKKIAQALSGLGIDDPKLVKKIASIPYVIRIDEGRVKYKRAGFFPWGGGNPMKRFVDGTKVNSKEFFEIMRKLGGGLTGEPTKPHSKQKGYAPSRIKPGATVNKGLGAGGDVYVDGFTVPGGWVEHYRKENKVPLNLFWTSISGDKARVNVMYISPKPIS
jgi:hypothetical protein